MPVTVFCSACRRRLKVRDAALGRRVRCPACGEVFVARLEARTDEEEERRNQGSPGSDDDTYTLQSDASPGASAPRRRDEGSRRHRRRTISGPDDEYDDRRGVRAHRGLLILTLGVLSVVLSCIPLAGWILGAVSMSMGSADQHLMEERWMERSGHGMTKAGQICGIFGVFFSTVIFILALFIRMNRYARHW